MEQTTKAIFQFIKYKIIEFSFVNPNEDKNEVSINFEPSGVYYKSAATYELKLKVSVSDSDENDFLNIVTIATFKFDETQDVPEYFYANAIAIVFPYIRAFINTLTSISNVKPLMLPLVNLTTLGTGLFENTITTD